MDEIAGRQALLIKEEHLVRFLIANMLNELSHAIAQSLRLEGARFSEIV